MPLLAACGAVPHTGTPEPGSSPGQTLAGSAETSPTSVRAGPVASLPEAWPRPAAGDADLLVDGDTSTTQYAVDPSVRLPWTLVMRVLAPPAEVAALGIFAADPERAITDLSVFAYQGSVPLDRANFPQFLEGSTRLGIARVEPATGWTVLRFAEPVVAHYVWFRVSGDATGQGVALAEVRLFSPDELTVLEETTAGAVAFATLLPVDTSPYEGINLLGLPDLGTNTNPLTDVDGTTEGSGAPPTGTDAQPSTPAP